MMSFKSEYKLYLKVPQEQKNKRRTKVYVLKGEVDPGSDLLRNQVTKEFSETEMLPAADDIGWEPVANVKFRAPGDNNNDENDDESPNAVPPPPEFSASPNENTFEGIAPPIEDTQKMTSPASPVGVIKNDRPARQYVYGADIMNLKKNFVIQTTSRTSSHENIIEAEIREQQMREEELRKETDLRNREKNGGASSPSSHTSDEGFVDRPLLLDEIPVPSSTVVATSIPEGGFTHTIKGHDGEHVIYDAVSPAPESFIDKTLVHCGGSSEAKIALEIRELKEREAELRSLRKLREREQLMRAGRGIIGHPRTGGAEAEEETEEEVERAQKLREREQLMRAGRGIIGHPRTGGAEAEEETEEEVERASSSSREPLDDHMTSLTTTTDEGNYSECGDAGSSEEKSSDGSNSSRMMSPDLHSFAPTETRPRKVTVKPFEDEDDAEPVYTQMKKESVIEREIRLAREREEAFRREKGLLVPSPPVPKTKISPHAQSPAAEPVVVNGLDKPLKVVIEPSKRGVQHRLATTRIQQDIEETSQRERELRSAGKIRTLSEDTVDSKVTRLSDLVTDQESITPRGSPVVSSASSVSSLSSSHSIGPTVNGHIPLVKRSSSPMGSLSTYSPPLLTLPTATRSQANPRLTRSMSTNNLSFSASQGSLRTPQKGLMQKFIASRGKMTGLAFAPASSPSGLLSVRRPASLSTASGIPTRPMKVSPKAPPVIRREDEAKGETQAPKIFRRKHATAEEKIQEELREMKKREEELRRLRARNMARSQPNLAEIDDDAELEDVAGSDGVDSASFLQEMNGLRSALSNPNLLEDEQKPTLAPPAEKVIRRRSALIAQWEGRIQQTTEF